MSPQDWLDLSAHNAHNRRPPERKVFGRESEPTRRRIFRLRRQLRITLYITIALYSISGALSGSVLYMVFRRFGWWPL